MRYGGRCFAPVLMMQARPSERRGAATRLQEVIIHGLQTASPRVTLCCRCNILRGKAVGSLVPGGKDHALSEFIGSGIWQLD